MDGQLGRGSKLSKAVSRASSKAPAALFSATRIASGRESFLRSSMVKLPPCTGVVVSKGRLFPV